MLLERGVLVSYETVRRQIMPAVEHRSHKGLNNRAETPICRFDDGSAQCRASDLRGACNGSSPHSQPSAITSFRLVLVAPPSIHLHRLCALAEWKAVAGIAT
jgi:putative transposase